MFADGKRGEFSVKRRKFHWWESFLGDSLGQEMLRKTKENPGIIWNLVGKARWFLDGAKGKQVLLLEGTEQDPGFLLAPKISTSQQLQELWQHPGDTVSPFPAVL